MKFVLFDLDDTLTDRPASLERYVARLLTDFAEQLGSVEAALVLSTIAEVDERGYAPRERVFTRLQTALAWRSVPALNRLTDHWREHFPRSTVLRAGALDTLNALRARGCTLGLVTNGPTVLQQGKIDEAGIEGAAGVGMQPIWLAGVHPWPEGVERPGHRIDRIEDVVRAVMGDLD